MPRFVFFARDRSGRTQSGVLEQTSFEAVVETLRRRQWLVLDVQAEAEAAPGESASWLAADVGRWLPVWSTDIELSLRQLAVRLKSGLTLLDSLGLLVENTQRSAMRRVWKLAKAWASRWKSTAAFQPSSYNWRTSASRRESSTSCCSGPRTCSSSAASSVRRF